MNAFICFIIQSLPVQYTHIFSSPLHRALDTARVICEMLPEPKPILLQDRRLVEQNMGQLENQSWAAGRSIVDPLLSSRDTPFPGGGESMNDVLRRAQDFVKDLITMDLTSSVLIVSHGMLLAELIHALCLETGKRWIDLQWSNTGIAVVRLEKTDDDEWQLLLENVNDTTHLQNAWGNIH